MKGIGTRIKLVRQEFGMTQKEFGKEVGISSNYVSEIETEKKDPSDPLLLAIEYRFGVNKDWILHGKSEKYVKDKILLTNQEMEIIKSLRGMPEENKKVIKALIGKLKKDS